MTDEQLRILRHMLGIDCRDKDPKEYRDYYCANPNNPQLHELQRLGMVTMYSNHDRYEWFTTTKRGKIAARASQRAMVNPKKRRVYLKWLSAQDAFPDLTFREFLTSPDFKESRDNA